MQTKPMITTSQKRNAGRLWNATLYQLRKVTTEAPETNSLKNVAEVKDGTIGG